MMLVDHLLLLDIEDRPNFLQFETRHLPFLFSGVVPILIFWMCFASLVVVQIFSPRNLCKEELTFPQRGKGVLPGVIAAYSPTSIWLQVTSHGATM